MNRTLLYTGLCVPFAFGACGGSVQVHDDRPAEPAPTDDATPPPSEPTPEPQADPEQALRNAARALANAPLTLPPELPQHIELEEEKRRRPRRRRDNPAPLDSWPEPAPTWEPALRLPTAMLADDMHHFPTHAPDACEIENWHWPPKSGPHDEVVFERVFVVEREHGQASVLWVDHLDDGVLDSEFRATWLTPTRLAAVEEHARRLRTGSSIGKRWEYGASGELLGEWRLVHGHDGQTQEHLEWRIDYDDRGHPVQVRRYDGPRPAYVIERVTWDEQHPLRVDTYRPSQEPGVYEQRSAESPTILSWTEGWLRRDDIDSRTQGPISTSIYAETPAGLRSVLHKRYYGGITSFSESFDEGSVFLERTAPSNGVETRQTFVRDDDQLLPLTRERREPPGDWVVETRWERSPERVEHWVGDTLMKVYYLDCEGRPRPEKLGF